MKPDITAGIVGDDDGELGFEFFVVECCILSLDEGWEDWMAEMLAVGGHNGEKKGVVDVVFEDYLWYGPV